MPTRTNIPDKQIVEIISNSKYFTTDYSTDVSQIIDQLIKRTILAHSQATVEENFKHMMYELSDTLFCVCTK